MNTNQAKDLVLQFLNDRNRDYKLMVYEPSIKTEYGWFFHYDQEGVFHPRVEEVTNKVKRIYNETASDEHVYDRLTEEELKIYENSISLSGTIPVFIDKETKEVSYCRSKIIEVEVQRIKESKTGNQYCWEIFLKEDITKNIAVLKQVKQKLGLTAIEILEFGKSFHREGAAKTINDIHFVLFLKDTLNTVGVLFEVKEKVLENQGVKKKGCPCCYNSQLTSFKYEHIEKDFEFHFLKEDKVDAISCHDCKTLFLNNNGTYKKISKQFLIFLNRWDKLENSDFPHFREAILSLRLVQILKGVNEAPCKIVTNNGTTYDFCTVMLVAEDVDLPDWIELVYKHYFLLSDIKTIEQSTYALNSQIRRLSLSTQEVSMSYRPVQLETKLGTQIIINGYEIFYRNGNIRGCDLSIAETPKELSGRTISANDFVAEAIILVKYKRNTSR